jgi:hypothetical protein
MRMSILGESDKIAAEGANFKKTIEINLSGKRNQYRTLLWRVHLLCHQRGLAIIGGRNFQVKGQRREIEPSSVLFLLKKGEYFRFRV